MRRINALVLACAVPLAAAALPLPALAAEMQHYNVVDLQSGAEREVANDQMQAMLYIEQNDPSAAQIASSMNRAITEALRLARDYPTVKARSGNNQTTPVYSRANQLQGWRGRAEIRLETRDFAAGAALIAKLQASLQLGGISFAVAPETRKKAEDELIAEAIGAFKARAELVRGVMGGKGYRIQHISLNTGYSGPPRPMMMSAKAADGAIAPPPLEGGTSVVNVQVSGSVEVE
jgi:predicted secreted protein